jgi:prevent-host-death family protein
MAPVLAVLSCRRDAGFIFPGWAMKSFGVTEARKRWSELLAQVESGHEIVITRKGKTIAKLVAAGEVAAGEVAAGEAADEKAAREAIEERQEEAVVHMPGEKSVRDMIEEA